MQTHRGIYNRGYLPHIDLPGLIQHVRFHLAGAIPAHVARMLECRHKRDRIRLTEEVLDRGSPTLRLADFEADIVESALLYFDRVRYDLISWAIMPNHVHVCFRQVSGWPLEKVLHSWKRHSSRAINDSKHSTGRTWERDYYDKAIRTERQLRNTVRYIEQNPVKARLVESPQAWRWSSAWGNRTRWPVFEPEW